MARTFSWWQMLGTQRQCRVRVASACQEFIEGWEEMGVNGNKGLLRAREANTWIAQENGVVLRSVDAGGTVNASNNHISAMFKPLRLNHIYFAYNLWTSSLHTFKIVVRWLIICNTMWTHVDLHMISTDAGFFFPSKYFLSAMVLCGGQRPALCLLSFHFFYMGLEDQIQVLRLAWCLNLHLWCCAKTLMRK